MHKNIPIILLVNTTSRDIKYFAYIPIAEVREKIPIQNGYIPRFEGFSRYLTDIAHAYFDFVITVASACASFHRQ